MAKYNILPPERAGFVTADQDQADYWRWRDYCRRNHEPFAAVGPPAPLVWVTLNMTTIWHNEPDGVVCAGPCRLHTSPTPSATRILAFAVSVNPAAIERGNVRFQVRLADYQAARRLARGVWYGWRRPDFMRQAASAAV